MAYLFCFDIDGTLRDNKNHEVSESTLKTLHLLKEKGYKLVVSSGRGYDSLKRTNVMDLINWDGYVLNNGQLILDGNRNVLSESHLSDKTIRETLRIANELNMCVAIKSQPRFLSKEPDDYVRTSIAYFNSVMPEVGTYTGQIADAMITYGPIGYDYAPFFEIEGLEVLPGESTYADLTIGGISKATGIDVLLKHHGLKEYVAFGDSLNDVEMFKYAAISIAMGQGNEKLKEMATYVTASIYDDGIYKACLHYKFI